MCKKLQESNIDIRSFGFATFESLDRSYELLISIGGDGTILRAITYVKDLEIPIVGINTGRLGFLATIPINNIESAMDRIFLGQYRISKRSLVTPLTAASSA